MWDREEDRLALLELLSAGRLRRRRGQAEAWQLLAERPWTRRTGRRDEIEVVAEHRPTVVELLNRVWPDWRLAADALAARGLQPTPADWRRLRDLLRAADLPRLPDRLNRRTAASAVAPHSKAALSAARRAALRESVVTRDGIVRLRPPPGLRFIRERAGVDAAEVAGVAASEVAGVDASAVAGVDAAEVAGVLGEVAITERALLDGTTLAGDVAAILLVENLGPYQDLDPPDGWLVAHVPGWDTATVRLFLERLRDVAVVHFGDLDPAGLRIVRHLRLARPDLRWAVPEFWGEHVDGRALPGEWPPDLDLSGAPSLVRDLARRGLWLEQETIAVDPRLRPALAATLAERPLVQA